MRARTHAGRSAYWDTQHDDRIEIAGDTLRVELGTPAGPRPVLEVLAAVLARAPRVSALDLGLWSRGCVEIDDVIAGPPARASGLEFLRRSQLPRLERFAIDFQFHWYVPWTPADTIALCEARLPSLARLELRYASDGDELCRHLVTAPFAAQLVHLELTGSDIGEAGARLLLHHRDAFPRLQRLVWLQPLDLPDAWWHELERAYPIEESR